MSTWDPWLHCRFFKTTLWGHSSELNILGCFNLPMYFFFLKNQYFPANVGCFSSLCKDLSCLPMTPNSRVHIFGYVENWIHWWCCIITCHSLSPAFHGPFTLFDILYLCTKWLHSGGPVTWKTWAVICAGLCRTFYFTWLKLISLLHLQVWAEQLNPTRVKYSLSLI